MREPIEPVYAEIGQRILAARTLATMTQEAVGARLDPPQTRASIANMENGKQRIMLHVLIQIAEALSVSLADLLPSRPSTERDLALVRAQQQLDEAARTFDRISVLAGSGASGTQFNLTRAFEERAPRRKVCRGAGKGTR